MPVSLGRKKRSMHDEMRISDSGNSLDEKDRDIEVDDDDMDDTGRDRTSMSKEIVFTLNGRKERYVVAQEVEAIVEDNMEPLLDEDSSIR